MRKHLAVGSLWTAGIRALINLIGVLNTILLARLLTPADFGLVAIATVVFAIVTAFMELPLSAALIQHRDPQREHFDTAFTLNGIRALIIAGVLAITAHITAAAYGDPRLVLIMYALGAGALITGAMNPRLVEFRRRLSFQQEMFVELANKLVGVVVAVTIAVVFRTYWAIVIGMLAAQMASLILSYILIPYWPRLSLLYWRSLFSFSSWLGLSAGLRAINYRADHLAVGAVLGTAPLGQYTVGDNLASLPVRESMAPLAYVLFPAFSKLQDDPSRMRDAYLRAQRLLVAVALPVGVGFALVAGPLVELALGPQWSSAALVIQILSTIYALNALSTPLTPLAMGMARTRILFLRDIVNLFVRYPLIFIGLFSGGLLGLLLARCVSGLFAVVLDMHIARKLVGPSVISQFVSNWRSIAATLIMCLAVWAGSYLDVGGSVILELVLVVLIGAISYSASVLALWYGAGRPPGPEREALDVLQLLRNKAIGA